MDMRTNYDMTYVYDGTLEGLYTCVFRCYEDKYIAEKLFLGVETKE